MDNITQDLLNAQRELIAKQKQIIQQQADNITLLQRIVDKQKQNITLLQQNTVLLNQLRLDSKFQASQN